MARTTTLIDMTGQRFGRLIAIQMAGPTAAGPMRWRFKCDCGAETVQTGTPVRSGKIVSCGCHRREMSTTHGATGTREHRIWKDMIQRCRNPKRRSFANYGGRGIKVCDRWENSFASFLEDVGPSPSSTHQIDRENNDGNYEPGNVRWATAKEQANNRRPRTTATHCRRGHEFTEQNTFVTKRGTRRCRTCIRASRRRTATGGRA